MTQNMDATNRWWGALWLTCLLLAGGSRVQAEDIDLFVGNPATEKGAVPTVLFVLDNSSAWAREQGTWPDPVAPGRSQLAAIGRVLAGMTDRIRVGLILHSTDGTATPPGGYVRYDVERLSARSLVDGLVPLLDGMSRQIAEPHETLTQAAAWGGLFRDVYNYLDGRPQSRLGSGTPAALADAGAYASRYDRFASPLSGYDDCANVHVVFVANPGEQGPVADDRGNSAALAALYAAAGVASPPDALAGVAGGEPLTLRGDDSGAAGRDFNIDDWAKFLLNYGPVVASANGGDATATRRRVPVVTHTVHVHDGSPGATASTLLARAAVVGGGSYHEARAYAELVAALRSIVAQVGAVTSSFSAVALPAPSGDAGASANEVYIGSFRPSVDKRPRWFGNLKRYRLGLFDDAVALADVDYRRAIDPLTGAPTACAVSWWTSDSGAYWDNLGVVPSPRGSCGDAGRQTSDWSDLPDGAFTEKGGAAQQQRAGAERRIYTVAGGRLDSLGEQYAPAMGGSAVRDYLWGSVPGVDEPYPLAGRRATVHGGVIHSRPLVVNYGGVSRIYYGGNGGLYRAVDAASGAEQWALVAPQHLARVRRLYDNSPPLLYSRYPEDAGAGHEPKDYFFDGATGHYLSRGDDGNVHEALIFPVMRRGGRQIYALDVSDPDRAPSLLWVHGCPDAGTDGCSGAPFEAIGHTWSAPVVVTIAGFADSAGEPVPVLILGGGRDGCLDVDSAPYPCPDSANGAMVFFLNARTGALLKRVAMAAPVVAAPVTVDADHDGHADFAYVADARGGLYRIALRPAGGPLDPRRDWVAVRVAEMRGVGAARRRFLSRPAAVAVPGSDLVAVVVGSGDREHPLADDYPFVDDVENRLYVFYDRLAGFPAGTVLPVDLDSLVDVSAGTSGDVAVIRRGNGWRYSLDGRGEQVVNPAVIGGGRVYFNSYRPGAGTAPCAPPLGRATAYSAPLLAPRRVDARPLPASGMPIPPVVATVEIVPEAFDPTCLGPECARPETRTVCIGCEGLDIVEISPSLRGIRRRMWWIEDIDK